MLDFEKLGKTIDTKVKELATSSEAFAINESKNLSALEQLKTEEKYLYMELGKTVYESERETERTAYEEIIQAIDNKRQMILDEQKRLEGPKCPTCGASVSEQANFCSTCGAKVEHETTVQENRCLACGEKVKAESKFCIKCGTKI